jgi:hypothetical protein
VALSGTAARDALRDIHSLPERTRIMTVLGMSLETFTLLHVLISLAGLGTGLIVVYGLLNAKRLDGWTAIFLTTTVLTSVTGFLFPVEHILPSHKVGIISLVVLAIAIVARYVFRLAGGWRRTYVLTAILAFYLNAFVAVVQSFLKIPALKAMAPTQKEPPFLVAQLIVLTIFIVLAIMATKKFRAEAMRPA